MVDNAIQMVTEKLSSWPCVRGIILGGVHVQEAPIQKILI